MTIRLLESFDGVSNITQFVNGSTSNQSLAGKWLSSVAGTPNASIFAGARTGQGLQAGSSGNCHVYTNAQNWGQEIFFGFGHLPSSIDATERMVCAVFDEQATSLISITRLNNTLKVWTDSNNAHTLRITSSNILTASVWGYVECRVKRAASPNGAVELKYNGSLVASVTGIDTRGTTASGGTYINYLTFFSADSVSGWTVAASSVGNSDVMDDFYLVDLTAGGATSYLGPTKVRCLRPSGNGNSSQWVGSDSDSTNNYLLVNEQNRDSSTYVASTNNGDKDTYAFDDTAAVGNIMGVQVVAQANYVTSAHGIEAVARLAGLESTKAMTGNYAATLSATERENWAVFETDPSSNTWTVANVNAAEFGYDQTA